MYKVYWTQGHGGEAQARSEDFDTDSLIAALAHMESLRARQRAGEAIGFVVMASENPNSVGHAGVADPSADYDWKKRRR